MTRTKFHPTWASPPGETISDLLLEKNLSERSFSNLLGLSITATRHLLSGDSAITLGLARRLSATIGASPTFWLNRDYAYRQHLHRNQKEKRDWLDELPVQEMIRFGWIKKSSRERLADECLRFFEVHSIAAWKRDLKSKLASSRFKSSSTYESERGPLAAWLQQATLEGRGMNSQQWSPKRFRDLLPKLRRLTRQKDTSRAIEQLKVKCGDCGVAVVTLPAPTGCRINGATRLLNKDKALLALSYRYKTVDHFWFAFFHEAAHLLLHNPNAFFVEGFKDVEAGQEKEADLFAQRILVPECCESEFRRLPTNAREVVRFARRVGIAPGIVVGQLQHQKLIGFNMLNSLKRTFTHKISN